MSSPGPWRAARPAHDSQAWDIRDVHGSVVAKLPWGSGNAYLIAAAPAMRALLIRHTEDCPCACDDDGQEPTCGVCEASVALLDALAKAGA